MTRVTAESAGGIVGRRRADEASMAPFHAPWQRSRGVTVFSARRCVPVRSRGDGYRPRVPFSRGTHAESGSATSRRLRRLVSAGGCTVGRLVRPMSIPLRIRVAARTEGASF